MQAADESLRMYTGVCVGMLGTCFITERLLLEAAGFVWYDAVL